jgi:hypothetical protein
MATTKPVLARLRSDQVQVLEVLAEYRQITAHDLASDILATWTDTIGRRELQRRLASPPPGTGHPRPGRRRELTGQMSVDDALRDAG